MSLIQLDNVSHAYGLEPLLEKASLSIESGERLCLIGRNGCGKSTLLALIEGRLSADSGEIKVQNDVKLSSLPQELPEPDDQTVYEFVASAFNEHVTLLKEWHHLSTQMTESDNAQQLVHLSRLQTELEANDVWHTQVQIDRTLSRLDLDPDAKLKDLSGGNRRMAALGKALATEPDILLLDEPTNHLDIEHIEWLEQNLTQLVPSLIFITHDRRFAETIATRIVELDRGELTSYPGTFKEYFKQKEHKEAAEDNERRRFDKKLSQEEVWIRQGIKARRTRNEGRVRALKALREKLKNRRDKTATAELTLNQEGRSGNLVAEFNSVTKSFAEKTIIKNFSHRLIRGDRLGILGRNGSGKTTLIKLLLGEITPDQGHVKLGTALDIAYFDQTKQRIDREKTVFDNIADGNEQVVVGGKAIHVMSYLQQFLFSPERARTPANALSGGEFSRLLIAKLFSKPANLLILDEPTNDLDIETLDVLEETIANYQGTLLLISHDRSFIDNTVTSVLHLDGKGNVSHHIGGYSDWKQRQLPTQSKTNSEIGTQTRPNKNKSKPSRLHKKLSFNDQRELNELPELIEQLEQQHADLLSISSSSDFHTQASDTIKSTYQQMAQLEQQIESAYNRWEQLS